MSLLDQYNKPNPATIAKLTMMGGRDGGSGGDYKYKSLPEDESSVEVDNNKKDDEEETCLPCSVLRIHSRHVTIGTVLLPLGAFIFSVFWAFHSDYRAATLVYCQENQVRNYLPSLSAAIGDFELSKSIWIFCITLHAPSRFFFSYVYYAYLETILYKRYHLWARLACFLNVIENCGLLGLSYISSRQSLPLHAFNFTVFIISSLLYMIILCILLSCCRNIPAVKNVEIKSQKWKIRLLVVILVCSLILPYVYNRHNTYCEQGVYTVFALVEYMVVLCNMGFHGTAYWDFYDKVFKIHIAKFVKEFEF